MLSPLLHHPKYQDVSIRSLNACGNGIFAKNFIVRIYKPNPFLSCSQKSPISCNTLDDGIIQHNDFMLYIVQPAEQINTRQTSLYQ